MKRLFWVVLLSLIAATGWGQKRTMITDKSVVRDSMEINGKVFKGIDDDTTLLTPSAKMVPSTEAVVKYVRDNSGVSNIVLSDSLEQERVKNQAVFDTLGRNQSVENLASLIAQKDRFNLGDQIWLSDNGARYKVLPSAHIADDGVSVIETTVGNFIVLQYNDFIDMRWFGVSQVDTLATALATQKALSFVGDSVRLVYPKGLFLLYDPTPEYNNTAIYVNEKKGISFEGQGIYATTLRVLSDTTLNTNREGFYVRGCPGIKFSSMTIEGEHLLDNTLQLTDPENDPNYNANHAIYFHRGTVPSDGIILEDLRLQKFNGVTILMVDTVRNFTFRNSIIRDIVRTNDGDCGVTTYGLVQATGLLVNNNGAMIDGLFENLDIINVLDPVGTGCARGLYLAGNTQNIVLRNVHFEKTYQNIKPKDNGSGGLKLIDSKNVLLDGCSGNNVNMPWYDVENITIVDGDWLDTEFEFNGLNIMFKDNKFRQKIPSSLNAFVRVTRYQANNTSVIVEDNEFFADATVTGNNRSRGVWAYSWESTGEMTVRNNKFNNLLYCVELGQSNDASDTIKNVFIRGNKFDNSTYAVQLRMVNGVSVTDNTSSTMSRIVHDGDARGGATGAVGVVEYGNLGINGYSDLSYNVNSVQTFSGTSRVIHNFRTQYSGSWYNGIVGTNRWEISEKDPVTQFSRGNLVLIDDGNTLNLGLNTGGSALLTNYTLDLNDSGDFLSSIRTTSGSGNIHVRFMNSGDNNDSWSLGRNNSGSFSIQYDATYPFAIADFGFSINQTGLIANGRYGSEDFSAATLGLTERDVVLVPSTTGSFLTKTLTNPKGGSSNIQSVIDSLAPEYRQFTPLIYNAIDTLLVDTLESGFNGMAISEDLANLQVESISYATTRTVTLDTQVRLIYYDVSAGSYTDFGAGTILNGTNYINVGGLAQSVAVGDWLFAEIISSGSEPNGLHISLKLR